MSKLKLTYFDFQGGRGEPPRLALSIGGIPFEDDRVPPAEWEGRKTHTPFGALPVLEREGQVVAQSNAINCYVGKQSEGAESSAVTRNPAATPGETGFSGCVPIAAASGRRDLLSQIFCVAARYDGHDHDGHRHRVTL
jgi:glutathione S-transferase-like protein